MVTGDYEHITDGLATGEVDVSLLPGAAVRPGQRSRELFDETGAFLVRRDHPRVRRRLTSKLFNSLRHIDVHLHLGRGGAGHRMAERWFQDHGLTRDVAVIVPHFTAAAMVAARSDYVAAMSRRMAEVFSEFLPVRAVELSPSMPSMRIVMSWHERTEHDAGSSAFRNLIGEALSA